MGAGSNRNILWLRIARWVFGIGLVVGVATLGWDWQKSLAPTPIRACFVEGRGHFVNITTGDGDAIRASVARCPTGKTISKQRGELVYRVDGTALGTTYDALFGRVLAMFALGIAFFMLRNRA